MYDPEDLEASERGLQFGGGWFAHPIYVNGDYPEVMKTLIGRKSQVQGYNTSRLPEFSDEEKKFINGIQSSNHLINTCINVCNPINI